VVTLIAIVVEPSAVAVCDVCFKPKNEGILLKTSSAAIFLLTGVPMNLLGQLMLLFFYLPFFSPKPFRECYSMHTHGPSEREVCTKVSFPLYHYLVLTVCTICQTY
jgi:hypothetical protein